MHTIDQALTHDVAAVSDAADSTFNPCVACGACCAQFRVSFYWTEGDDAPGGWVPVQFTRRLNAHLRTLQGTDLPPHRCVALAGEVGRQVSCTIYAQRPSPCREFDWRKEDGTLDERCTAARQAVGLPALLVPGGWRG